MLRLVKKPAELVLAPEGANILALGEHSGHGHVAVECDVYMGPKEKKYVIPKDPKHAKLLHKHLVTDNVADHEPIVMDKPIAEDECYEVVIQRRYDPFTKMYEKVID